MEERTFPRILCLGEPMVEFVRVGGPESGTYQIGVGGDTSNAAIAAARQGAQVGYLTALGQDRFGDRIADLWAHEGIDASAVSRNPDAPTGVYFIEPDPAERQFSYYRKGSAASLYSADDLPKPYLNHADALHLSGITLAVSDQLREAAFAAIAHMRAGGGLVSFDTNLRLKLWDIDTAREIIQTAARQTNLLITSIEDGEALTGTSDVAQIAKHYADFGCDVVIVTLGGDGASVLHNGNLRHVPPAAATPMDSTGAGDSFVGAFLAWWLEIGDPWDAATLASIVAAGTVSGLGAVTPIPRRKAVLEEAARMGLEL